MREKVNHKLLTFFSLYLSQSVPMSFFSTIIPIIMRQENFSLTVIGLLQFIKLPWVLKFIWAPYIDRHTPTLKDFKKWIFSSEILYAAIIFCIAFLDLRLNFYIIFVLIIVAFTTSATMDIATDALNALSFSKREKSMGNSMQSLGSFGGSLIGAGLLVTLYNLIGWTSVLVLLSTLVATSIIPLRSHKDIDIENKKSKTQKVGLKDIPLFFKSRHRRKQIYFLLLFYTGIIGTLAMIKPFMVDLGYSSGEIGFMFGIFGPLCGSATSISAGKIIKKIGRFNSRRLIGLLIFISTLLFTALSFLNSVPLHVIYIVIAFIWGSYGMASVVVYTTSMDYVRGGREGTDFTIQTVITHISGILIVVVSGRVGDILGYKGIAIMESIIALFSLIYIISTFSKESNE